MLPTDIDEDFVIVGPDSDYPATSEDFTAVRVPAGATHLFVTADDSYFDDNSDPDNDYQMTMDVYCGADCNLDGSVTPADFSAWVAAYNANDPLADINLDGSVTLLIFCMGSCL